MSPTCIGRCDRISDRNVRNEPIATNPESERIEVRRQTETLPRLVAIPDIPERIWRNLHSRHERERQAAILDYKWTGRVLEIGSGRGFVACLLALTSDLTSLIGLEPNPTYLRQSHQLAITNGAGSFTPVAGAGERLPFLSATFDWVLISEVLEHIRQPVPVVREAARVLRPGGYALLTVPCHGAMPPGTVAGHAQDFTAEEFRQVIDQANLQLVDQQTVAIFQFFLVRRRA